MSARGRYETAQNYRIIFFLWLRHKRCGKGCDLLFFFILSLFIFFLPFPFHFPSFLSFIFPKEGVQLYFQRLGNKAIGSSVKVQTLVFPDLLFRVSLCSRLFWHNVCIEFGNAKGVGGIYKPRILIKVHFLMWWIID